MYAQWGAAARPSRWFALALWLAPWAQVAAQDRVPIGGFIPLVGIGLTDEYKNASTDLTGTFFIADREDAVVGSPLTGTAQPFYDIALLDTGAATHILTQPASGPAGFDIDGNDFDGTNTQVVGGATGLISLEINDPLGFFAAGLGDRTSSGDRLGMNASALRGQSSVATLSAPSSWKLPNIVGLPLAAQHGIAIWNDQPQVFAHQGTTVRTPQVDFIPLGTGGEQGIQRRTDLKARPGASFIAGPLYVQNLDILGGNFEFHENPLSPTVIENGGLFIDVDFANGDPLLPGFPLREHELQDVELLFDTGADLTVVSELTAKRLGFDPVLDEPDFVLEVEGSGGVQAGIPGFYVAELNIDTVGGSFTVYNVPLAVLDVTNPNDPGNTIAGILGMHLFNDRNLVIDANASIGQGGAGPSLYISDPITQQRQWAATAATAPWNSAGSWNDPAGPGPLAVMHVRNAAAQPQTAVLGAGTSSLVYEVRVSGNGAHAMDLRVEAGAELVVYGETQLLAGGSLTLAGGRLDARLVSLEGGALRGSGEIYAGAGPISGVVRNLSGVIAPGEASGDVGALTIEGDLSLLAGATLAFDLGGTGAGQYDRISTDRFAFLAGTLDVRLSPNFTPAIGDAFTLLTAEESVVGQFTQLRLPTSFTWNVDYQAESVVLSVTGVGSLPGDFNGDGLVDAADLAAWQDGFGDAMDGGDLLAWQRGLQAAGTAFATNVPEPHAGAWVVVAAMALTRRGARRSAALGPTR
jgi:hypothetical protein